MSGFSIDITGDINEKLDGVTEKVKAIIQDELTEFGNATVISAINYAPTDEGFLRTHITSDPVPNELAIEINVAANYAAYVEFGTRKFAAAYVASLPPTWQEYAATFKGKGGGDYYDFLNNILDWVMRKGIASRTSEKTGKFIPIKLGSGSKDEDNLANVAYAIALSIIRNGIKPHPFLFPAIEENLIKLKQNLSTI